MKRYFDNPFLFSGSATSVGTFTGAAELPNAPSFTAGSALPASIPLWHVGVPCVYASAHTAFQLNRYNELVQQLNELGELVDNWDGYGGSSFSQSALDQARHLLGAHLRSSGKVSLPNIVPTSNGTVALEWQEGDSEAVVEIGATRISGFIKAHNSPPVFLAGAGSTYTEVLPTVIGHCLTTEPAKAASINQVEYQRTGND